MKTACPVGKHVWAAAIVAACLGLVSVTSTAATAQTLMESLTILSVPEEAAPSAPVPQQPPPPPHFAGTLTIGEGRQADIAVEGLKRYLVGAPNLVSAQQSSEGLRVTGKQPGTTVLALWSDDGQSSYQIRVVDAADAAAAQAVRNPAEMTLQPGGSEVLKGKGITRTSVSDPGVVDIVPVSTTEVLVNAKKEGVATVRIWDENGLATYIIRVGEPVATPEETAANIEKEIGIPGVSVRVAGDAVILSGVTPTAEVMQRAVSVAEATGMKVVNLITVESVTAQKLVASLKAALPGEDLTYQELPDQTVLITGSVPSAEEATKIQDVIQAWIGTPEQMTQKPQTASITFGGLQQTPLDVVDRARVQARETSEGNVLVTEEYTYARRVFGGRVQNGPRIVAILEINPSLAKQILVSAQVVEIDRVKLKQLGIEWSTFIGGVAQPLFQIVEDRPPLIPLDDAGPFRRTPIDAAVKALESEDAARILSEPKLLIADGHSANILVGGEFPIPVAQSSVIGGVGNVTIQFKTFGIQLTVKPKTTPDDRILLTLTPEVSALDYTNAIRAYDILIPAIKTRRSTSTVHMSNGETLAIGGLLSNEDVKTIEAVPLLSKIPIIGELFKSTRFERNETELVILVTPQIVESGAEVPISVPE